MVTMVRVAVNTLSNHHTLTLNHPPVAVMTVEVVALPPLHNLANSFLNQVRRFNAMSSDMLMFAALMMITVSAAMVVPTEFVSSSSLAN